MPTTRRTPTEADQPITELQIPEPEFDPTLTEEAINRLVQDSTVSLDILTFRVRQSRQKRRITAGATAVHAEQTTETLTSTTDTGNPSRSETGRKSLFLGGSFSKGLERWIRRTKVSEDMVYEPHKELLSPSSIQKQLRPMGEMFVYKGLLYTAEEYTAITFSPKRLIGTLDATVHAKRDLRTPSEKLARSDELQQEALLKRNERVTAALNGLNNDLTLATTLGREMQIIRHAHMTARSMDSLMSEMGQRYHQMVIAITRNHRAKTEVVNSFTTALDSLLASPNKSEALNYWRGINDVYIGWAESKKQGLVTVQQDIMSKVTELGLVQESV